MGSTGALSSSRLPLLPARGRRPTDVATPRGSPDTPSSMSRMDMGPEGGDSEPWRCSDVSDEVCEPADPSRRKSPMTDAVLGCSMPPARASESERHKTTACQHAHALVQRAEDHPRGQRRDTQRKGEPCSPHSLQSYLATNV